MKVYISGKISGLPLGEVREKFAHAERQIEAFGHTPVNPLKNGLPTDAEWEEQMLASIRLLFGSDAIYMLPDWFNSKGARIERNIAIERELEIINQPECGYHKSNIKQP